MINAENDPLILTLEIDLEAKQHFTALRKLYFPPEKNYLDAHIALFHNLPINEPGIYETIESIVSAQREMSLTVGSIVSIGNGTAFKIINDDLQRMHKQMQQQWTQWLIPQDKNKLWPHITIQNKVTAEDAKALQQQLVPNHKPFEIKGIGIGLWKYKGGPWEYVKTYKFKSPSNLPRKVRL